jgi:flavodoxin
MNIVTWVTTHWAEIAQVIAAIIGVASIIVKLTPSLKDDTMLQKIIAFIGKYIALNKTVKDEDRPK